MRRVHREATECVGANRLGLNGMRGRVHQEGLDGTGMETRTSIPQTEETGRGPAYRKTEETDLLWLKRGSC